MELSYSCSLLHSAPLHASAPPLVPSPAGEGPGQQPQLLWVCPPSLASIRDQACQLQRQKRGKQKQRLTVDPSPSAFVVPPQLLPPPNPAAPNTLPSTMR